MMDARKYLTVLAVTFALGAVIISGVNLLIDPYFIYDTSAIPYVNVAKPKFGNRRTFMPIYIDRHASEVLVLGSSRGTAVYEALKEIWPQKTTQDASVSALRAREAIEYLTLFSSRPEIKTIVYQPDFFSFNRNFMYHPSFVPTIVGKGQLWRLQAVSIFGLSTFISSIQTLIDNLKSGKSARNPLDGLGDVPRVETVDEMRKQFKYQLANFDKSPEFYQGFELDRAVFDDLATTLRQVVKSGKELILLVGPAHALQWQQIAESGKWEQFETWKTLLATLSDSIGVPLWDFASFSPISTLHADEIALPWYVDSSHFTRNTAQVALRCVLVKEDCERLDGAPLTSATVAERLKAIRDKRQKWLSRPAMDADLSLLARRHDH